MLFHKVFGFLSIMSFFYRYGVLYPEHGDLHFTGNFLDWCNLLVLIGIPISALQFDVPAKRMMRKPMVIWEEYRLHAIVFSLRGFSVYAFGLLCNVEYYRWLLQFCFIMGHHLVVDEITRRHGDPNHTTVRVGNNDIHKETGITRAIKRSYSLYQFIALASHLLPHEIYTPELGFNAFIAVSSSAFLMTLYRKRIIRGRTHFLIYTFCLMLSIYHIIRVFPQIWFLATVVAGFVLRVKFRLSKYAIWFVFCVINSPQVQPYWLEGSFLETEWPHRVCWAIVLPVCSAWIYTYENFISKKAKAPTPVKED